MRKSGHDMEMAIDVPRLRAVPSTTAAEMPGDDPSDAELLARIANSDREAFELLYHRYVRSVMGLALRRLHDRADAEDVVQEAFASVWRAAGSYSPERGAAGGWLYTVARNAIIDRSRRARFLTTAAELPELPSPEDGPDAMADQTYTA